MVSVLWSSVCLSVLHQGKSWDRPRWKHPVWLSLTCLSPPSVLTWREGTGFGWPSTAHLPLSGSTEGRNSTSFHSGANLTRFSPLCTFTLLSGVIFIALEPCLQAQMVPEMNKSKPHSSRPGSSYIKVLQFGLAVIWGCVLIYTNWNVPVHHGDAMNFCVAFGTRPNHLAPVKSTRGITASGAMSELCFDHHHEFFLYRTSPSANLIEQRLFALADKA